MVLIDARLVRTVRAFLHHQARLAQVPQGAADGSDLGVAHPPGLTPVIILLDGKVIDPPNDSLRRERP
jgi:hypothetical protein